MPPKEEENKNDKKVAKEEGGMMDFNKLKTGEYVLHVIFLTKQRTLKHKNKKKLRFMFKKQED